MVYSIARNRENVSMSSSSNGERARSLRVDSAFVSASGTPVFEYNHVGDSYASFWKEPHLLN